ncbi:hypothetical protein BJ508DRAFT_411782 [Ascobolus immersus RN42]|uniref:Uncharacterized protein n=1 Tax=Ascobolus immersus RN42 TaxID=1160509 RepID=A0A3N4IIY4_ASCIM|nr:hypothetical protein BJ508DRAFT_411782 [Ascobolus immersus RN42]
MELVSQPFDTAQVWSDGYMSTGSSSFQTQTEGDTNYNSICRDNVPPCSVATTSTSFSAIPRIRSREDRPKGPEELTFHSGSQISTTQDETYLLLMRPRPTEALLSHFASINPIPNCSCQHSTSCQFSPQPYPQDQSWVPYCPGTSNQGPSTPLSDSFTAPSRPESSDIPPFAESTSSCSPWSATATPPPLPLDSYPYGIPSCSSSTIGLSWEIPPALPVSASTNAYAYERSLCNSPDTPSPLHDIYSEDESAISLHRNAQEAAQFNTFDRLKPGETSSQTQRGRRIRRKPKMKDMMMVLNGGDMSLWKRTGRRRVE